MAYESACQSQCVDRRTPVCPSITAKAKILHTNIILIFKIVIENSISVCLLNQNLVLFPFSNQPKSDTSCLTRDGGCHNRRCKMSGLVRVYTFVGTISEETHVRNFVSDCLFNYIVNRSSVPHQLGTEDCF